MGGGFLIAEIFSQKYMAAASAFALLASTPVFAIFDTRQHVGSIPNYKEVLLTLPGKWPHSLMLSVLPSCESAITHRRRPIPILHLHLEAVIMFSLSCLYSRLK